MKLGIIDNFADWILQEISPDNSFSREVCKSISIQELLERETTKEGEKREGKDSKHETLYFFLLLHPKKT